MTSYSRLIMLVAAALSALLLAASYLFFSGFSAHILKNAAVRQAETMAQVTFASMYQLMSKGWNRDQVIDFTDITATSVANTPTRITFYRAEPVSRQFGPVENPAVGPALRAALTSGRAQESETDDGLIYHMPLVAMDNCLRCHSAVKRGEVMGAISVETKFAKDMRESNLHMFLVMLLLAPAPFLVVLVVAIHLQHRFDAFTHGLDVAAEAARDGKPVDLSRVPTRYQEFADILARIKRLLS